MVRRQGALARLDGPRTGSSAPAGKEGGMKRKPLAPALNKLRNQVIDHIGERKGCMVMADLGGSVIVFNRKKFVAVETVNEAGFQPYTSQREVQVPVPLVLIFDKRD